MEGWANIAWSTTMHYFRGRRSLCGGYGFIEPVSTMPDCSNKCKTCEKILKEESK